MAGSRWAWQGTGGFGMNRERMTTDRVVRVGSTGKSRGAVSQPVGSSCAAVRAPMGARPHLRGVGVCWSSPWCLGSELWVVPGGRGQSRFSGTGWAGRSMGWRLMGRGGGGGKPQSDVSFTVPLGSPPGGVQLSLRAPGGVCGVTTGESCSPCPDGTRGRAACAASVLPCLAAAHPPGCILRPAPVASLDLALAVHITSSLLYLLPSVLVTPGEVAVEVAGSKKLLGGKRRRWQRVLLKSLPVSGSILNSGTGVCVCWEDG